MKVTILTNNLQTSPFSPFSWWCTVAHFWPGTFQQPQGWSPSCYFLTLNDDQHHSSITACRKNTHDHSNDKDSTGEINATVTFDPITSCPRGRDPTTRWHHIWSNGGSWVTRWWYRWMNPGFVYNNQFYWTSAPLCFFLSYISIFSILLYTLESHKSANTCCHGKFSGYKGGLGSGPIYWPVNQHMCFSS